MQRGKNHLDNDEAINLVHHGIEVIPQKYRHRISTTFVFVYNRGNMASKGLLLSYLFNFCNRCFHFMFEINHH